MRTAEQGIWFDQEIFLWFLQNGAYPKLMWCAALSNVHIGQGLGSTWGCSYCGSTMPASSLGCSACNAPRKTRKRRATALLTGVLPQLVWFDAVKDGFTLEARRQRHDPRNYDGGEPVARLANCKIVGKDIPTLMVGYSYAGDTPMPLELIAEIEGDFSFADAEHEEAEDERSASSH